MAALWEKIELFLWNVLHRPSLTDLADILLVAFVIYQLLKMTKETRGSAVLKGLLLLLLIVGVSNLLGLTALNWLLMQVLSNGALVLVILFQPEIRKALEKIGRGAKLDKVRQTDDDEGARVVEAIIDCLTKLSRRRVGALLVFERKTGLKDIIDTGIVIDSRISSSLLENIFEPNTPLHDGAVVIRGMRVMAAACILTLTESNGVSHDLGTRHRAALGVSETTDAVALIVSEETGIISVASGGKLVRHLDSKTLRSMLEDMYLTQRNPKKLLPWLTGRKEKKEEEAE